MMDRNGATRKMTEGFALSRDFSSRFFLGRRSLGTLPLTKLRRTTSGPPIRGGIRLPQFPDRNFCDRSFVRFGTLVQLSSSRRLGCAFRSCAGSIQALIGNQICPAAFESGGRIAD